MWQSGEYYTFKQFEAKAKKFEKTHFKGTDKDDLTELEIETLFWKDWEGKPFSVEYANDVGGSAFAPITRKGLRGVGEPESVGETSWNMRGVSRENGSLLRFVEEDIPGVTSPMMHLAMLFSWVGWHVENHDLHSLNYIHMGEAKTWYGVPKEAALAFEEVVRVHEFEGNSNTLVTCATLAKKATITSPDVLINAGVPCCRLVQNAGEFVVTFPRAYYSGVSHGFNCAEAANIATPEWLKVAKKAAVRRASMNYPPMFSHLHLLYAHALSLYSRVPLSISAEPRRSRLKEKKRSEGEPLLKGQFVEDVIQSNELLHVLLEQGSSCVLLPQKFSNIFCSKRQSYDSHSRGPYSSSFCERNQSPSFSAKYSRYENVDLCSSTSEIQDSSTEKGSLSPVGGTFHHGMFSCVMCGISSFPCAAVIEPREAAFKYLASTDCHLLKDSAVLSGTPDDEHTDTNWGVNTSELNFCSGQLKTSDNDKTSKGVSSLDLLVAAYGNPSDSEDEKVDSDMPVTAQSNTFYRRDGSESADEVLSSDSDCVSDNTSGSLEQEPGDSEDEANSSLYNHISSNVDGGTQNPAHSSWCPKACCRNNGRAKANMKSKCKQHLEGDLSKMHIFCLEHAVEVEKQLRPIGGMHVLLVCHPDYPRVETEAKVLAEELGLDHFWNDILFREATKNDVAIFQSALNVEEAVPGSEDWSVKLGIDLSYSASLSQSPFYKHVPSNSVICKAFGISSPTNSSEEAVLSGKRPLKHSKKVAAGKWCGKVWMSNQIHPFVERGVSQKAEPIKKFHSQVTSELKSKIKSEVELSNQTEQPMLPNQTSSNSKTTTVIKTYERKRKGAVKNEEIKKALCLKETSSIEAAEYSPRHSSPPQSESVLRRGQRKRKPSLLFDNTANSIWQCDPIAKQEPDSGAVTRPRRRPFVPSEEEDVKPVSKKQQLKKVTAKKYKTMKEMEEPYHCDIVECTMAFSSKQELALHKRNICLVEGCGKKFFSHKYLVQHKRVHTDDRPLKCPWKGCTMTFKWAWARTEHIRVHTGVRPYECQEPGCGQTFRFVTDFSRHRRKTGHAVRKDKE